MHIPLRDSLPAAAVATRGLTRRFGPITAVDGVDLAVPTGSFFGLVGSNGAGKSTTVRLLSGLIRSSAGEARVLALDPLRDGLELRRRIGVVPDFPVLYELLTPEENVLRLGRLRGMAKGELSRRLSELAGALGLADELKQPVRALSQGTRKKAALAAALVHGPSLLFLDEPFEGIDPVAAAGIRGLLEVLRGRGVTIFLTSHVLPLVERLATHVGILHEGHLLAAGPTAEVIGAHGSLEQAIVERLGGSGPAPALDWYAP